MAHSRTTACSTLEQIASRLDCGMRTDLVVPRHKPLLENLTSLVVVDEHSDVSGRCYSQCRNRCCMLPAQFGALASSSPWVVLLALDLERRYHSMRVKASDNQDASDASDRRTVADSRASVVVAVRDELGADAVVHGLDFSDLQLNDAEAGAALLEQKSLRMSDYLLQRPRPEEVSAEDPCRDEQEVRTAACFACS